MDAQWIFSGGAVEIRKIRTFPLCDFIALGSGRLWKKTLRVAFCAWEDGLCVGSLPRVLPCHSHGPELRLHRLPTRSQTNSLIAGFSGSPSKFSTSTKRFFKGAPAKAAVRKVWTGLPKLDSEHRDVSAFKRRRQPPPLHGRFISNGMISPGLWARLGLDYRFKRRTSSCLSPPPWVGHS